MRASVAVECRGLRYAFGGTVAVNGLDLTVAPGEIFGLLGPNGAGKTTTIRALIGLLPVPAGTISVFGLDVTRQMMAVRRLIGYVPQMLSADGALTGRQNVMLFARLFDVPRRQRAGRAADAIAAMGLADAMDRPAATYSGGMIRRLELAQALVSSPRLLVLDEPTIGLDPVARAVVWDRIAEVRQRTNMTVLLTTHYMSEAEESCDRVALMQHGRIRATGSPTDLIGRLGVEGATLDDVFRAYATDAVGATADEQRGSLRDVRGTRTTARRLG